jgi:hypothetical protein
MIGWDGDGSAVKRGGWRSGGVFCFSRLDKLEWNNRKSSADSVL